MSTAAVATHHRLTVGSIDAAPLRSMLTGQQADILYCDPPWDDGHMKSFAKGASRSLPGSPLVPLPWGTFMAGLGAVIEHHVKGWVFVEMGTRYTPAAEVHLKRVCRDLALHTFTYGSPRKPANLIVGHTEQSAQGWQMPAGAERGGLRMVKAVVASVARPGQLLLDPCCGFGYSAKAALASNLSFFGNELDPARAEATRLLLEGK